MSTEIEAARLLTYKAAFLKDQGRNFSLTAAQAKLKTGRLAVRATEEAVQIHGGYGYIEEYPGVPLLPRREDPHHRRGHRRGAADGHRPRTLGA
jgi:alkylation response protein AidB-like acyl-CoA dehydrogenase